MSHITCARLPGAAFCLLYPPPASQAPNWHPQAILPPMSIQRLCDLNESSTDQLDELLRDGEYVDGLLRLPEPELVQVVNHLDNVRFAFGNSNLANCFYRYWFALIAPVGHPNVASGYCGGYVAFGKFSPRPISFLRMFQRFARDGIHLASPVDLMRGPSVRP